MATGVNWWALGLALSSFFISVLALFWNVYATRREWARVKLEADTYEVHKVRYVRGTIRNTGSTDIGIENSWFRWRPWALRMNPVPSGGSPGALAVGEENAKERWHRVRLRTSDIDLRRRGRSGNRNGDVEDYGLALLLPAGSVFDFWVVVPPRADPDPRDLPGWEELGQLLSSRGRVTLNFRTARDRSVRAVVRQCQDRAWVPDTPPGLASQPATPRPDGSG